MSVPMTQELTVLVTGLFVGFGAGFGVCWLILRARVSDECGKEAAIKVFRESTDLK